MTYQTIPDLPCFYDPECSENNGTLLKNEAHHALHVLRLKINDSILVTNGKGLLAHAQVVDAKRDELVYSVTKKINSTQTNPFNTTLVIGQLANQNRLEFLVEKAVELGVNNILVLKSARSTKKTLNHTKLFKTAVAAVKQSYKSWIPDITEINFDELCALKERPIVLFTCDEKSKTPLKDLKKIQPQTIVIGPEGDFTVEELNLASKCDIIFGDLGSERLRSETAAIFALSCIKLNEL